jgi:type I restriction enzyme, S subunit
MSWKKKFVGNWGQLGMKYNWTTKKLSEIAYINPRESIGKGVVAKKVPMDKLQPFCRDVPQFVFEEYKGGTKFRNDDTIMARITPCLENGKVAKVSILSTDEIGFGSTEYIVFRAIDGVSDADFLYYLICSPLVRDPAIKSMVGSSGRQRVQTDVVANLGIELPPLEEQRKIGELLKTFDDKIKLNNEINNNLEEQLSALFVNMFGHFIDSLDNSDIKLGDLIESVDNRGKTPPLSDEPTDYPIIDVRALSGNSRIIDYTNCTKYVSKETYNNWFRSGHPKEYDILISTVGSLAEMKIFLGTTGCIAQNVVGFRTKGISPLYLYQYLNYIKNDLVAYNIGSVQPSIKVTHIIKHSIYVASKEDIEIFDSIARDITKKIFANCQENEALKQMRDTLLPKLMSGELDVSNIEI